MPSLWEQTLDNALSFPPLEGDKKTDVLIVGGGMAGVVLAYLLRRRGVDCLLTEANHLGSGATGHTTAKITAQHGLIYADLIRRQGLEAAKAYYQLQTQAIGRFHELARDFPCQMQARAAYVYSRRDRAGLDREARAYARMGVPVLWQERPPLPMGTVGALGMPDQAQFHPLQLLYGLARDLPIHEHTPVLRIEEGCAYTGRGCVEARRIVLCTHYPMINLRGLYFMKLYQHRSYVLALDNAPDVQGMYLDERPDGLSFRNYSRLLLVGGADHRTGGKGPGWELLRGFTHQAYPQAQERFAWAAQDCMSLDGLPYIGMHRSGTRALLVATGFNKWGMTGSMASAMMLADLIAYDRCEYRELLSPQRPMRFPQLINNSLSALWGLVRIGGPRCTHMGCKLRWNPVQRSWDCGCHGSRFDERGHVLDNPALRGLSE